VVADDQKRLYVQLGRRDKFFVREIAEFFSDLLDIPQRQVDGIVVKDSFSLVSLPIEAAERALQMSQRDSSIPHMHLDEKPAGNGGGKRRSRGESEERDLPRSKSNRKKGKDNSEGSWSLKVSEKSSFDKSRSKGGKGSGRSFGGGSPGRFSEGKSKKGTVRGGSSASLYKRKLPQ
jgi:ATP-dependent RNA helicase DeaD